MRHAAIIIAACAAPIVGCRRDAPPDTTGTMTAAEHARMVAGDAAASDSGGRAERLPVHLTAAQARAIGLTFTTVERGPLVRTVRTVGQVVAAEPGLADVTSKVDGFVDELLVNATGAPVRRGQPLVTLYSPMLVAAQEELLTAKRLAAAVDSTDRRAWTNAQTLVDAARRRLSYWDISDDQIERLERSGAVTKTLALQAPFDAVVLEKMVVAGQAVMAGMKLYRLADLSTIWIEGAVFEQDLALVRVGAPVRTEVTAYPGRSFAGQVSFVWPTVDEQSRTARVRVALANPTRLLKPGMYASLFIETGTAAPVLHVPAEAVIMTGERNLVFVAGGDGSLEPRAIIIGARAGERIEVRGGLAAGERIVASANFLVDAESRLAGDGGMAGMPGMPGMPDMPAETRKP